VGRPATTGVGPPSLRQRQDLTRKGEAPVRSARLPGRSDWRFPFASQILPLTKRRRTHARCRRTTHMFTIIVASLLQEDHCSIPRGKILYIVLWIHRGQGCVALYNRAAVQDIKLNFCHIFILHTCVRQPSPVRGPLRSTRLSAEKPKRYERPSSSALQP
jgi:hypothetical protein